MKTAKDAYAYLCLRASVAEFQAFFTSDNLQKPNLWYILLLSFERGA